MTERPIFVVGCPSSGNTLMFTLLEAHSNISCGNETDFLVDFQEIVDGKYWGKLQKYRSDKEYWHEILAGMFSRFKEDYALKHGKQRWADKTPCYTPHLDFICKLFPNCQIIHIIRDGRDVVMSARRRWGYRSAVKMIYKWREYVGSARQFGNTLPKNQYLEVRYEELVMNSEIAAKEIFSYLQEPWEPQVLHFDKTSSYSSARTYERYTEKVRKEANTENFIYRSRVGKGKDLDLFLKTAFHLSNGQLVKELGYS